MHTSLVCACSQRVDVGVPGNPRNVKKEKARMGRGRKEEERVLKRRKVLRRRGRPWKKEGAKEVHDSG